MARPTTTADDGVVKTEQRSHDRLLEPSLLAVDQLDADAILIGLCSDVRPLGGLLGMLDWRLCGRVSTMVERGAITGVDGEKVLFPTLGRIKVPRLFSTAGGRTPRPRARAASASPP